MKSVSFKKQGYLDLFGIVKLSPGVNLLHDSQWDQVKSLKLGNNKEPYVLWARDQGIIDFVDDESPATADESDSGAPSDEAAAKHEPAVSTAAPESDPSPAPKKRGRPPKGT